MVFADLNGDNELSMAVTLPCREFGRFWPDSRFVGKGSRDDCPR